MTAIAASSDVRVDVRVDARVQRLSTASARHVLEPDDLFDWSALGPGSPIARELTSLAGLDVELTDEQWGRLGREEVAAMLTAGIYFEAILNAGMSLQIAHRYDVTDPRVTFMLHEIGEETRHSRAFARLVRELDPSAVDPFDRPAIRAVVRWFDQSVLREPALFTVFVLAGEEIPDLLQRLASEHPDTDPLLAAVNRYHRQEEARHLAYARLVLPEVWADAGTVQRARVRHLAPLVIGTMFDTLVHPGVYASVGLPPWRTWWAAARTPERVAIRHEATRPILATLVEHGVFEGVPVSLPWRRLCGVDRRGRPVA